MSASADRADRADLAALVLAAIACLDEKGPPAGWQADMLAPCVRELRRRPGPADERLVATAAALQLDDAELLAIALCLAADCDAHAARALNALQKPLGGSRPLLGFAASGVGARWEHRSSGSPVGGRSRRGCW